MRRSIGRSVAAGGVLILSTCAVAQGSDAGYWRAVSNTARGITGDIQISETKITINFASYTAADITPVTSAEGQALFNTGEAGLGTLYRVDIPGDKRFLHKNTLCGGEPVTYAATYVSGKQLSLALFSGGKLPSLTPDAIANSTSLCGTFGYSR